MKKAGFVSISGQPNVGKSTLVNAFLGEKISIISKKPETTRDNIKGILTEGDTQIIFTDTPGLHRPHDLLGKMMVTRAKSSMLESDVILFLTERKIALNEVDKNIIAEFPGEESGKKVLLLINKVDQIKDKKIILAIIDEASKLYPFADIMPISALDKNDTKKVLNTVKKYLSESEFLYPEDQISDKNERFMTQEIIREKILDALREEVPYSTAVMIEDFKEINKKKLIMIYAVIYVERTSQKGILIGKNGEMLKKIGKLARLECEKMLGKRVYLNLWVKVAEKWKKDIKALEEMGYTD